MQYLKIITIGTINKTIEIKHKLAVYVIFLNTVVPASNHLPNIV